MSFDIKPVAAGSRVGAATVDTSPIKRASVRGVELSLRFESGKAVLWWDGSDRSALDLIAYQDRFVLRNLTTGACASSAKARRFDRLSVAGRPNDRYAIEVYGWARLFGPETLLRSQAI